MSAVALGFGEDTAELGHHLCLFHDGEAERRTRCAQFLGPALARADEGILLFGAGEASRGMFRQLEADTGGPLQREVERGRIVLARSDHDVSVHEEKQLGACDELARRGFGLIRAVAKVEWDVPGFPPPEDILWYESRLDQFLAGRPVLMLCTYDLAELPGAALVYGGLETHRSTLTAGRISMSPRYLPAERYLRERLLRLPWLT